MVFNLSYNNKKTSSSNEEDAIRTGLEPATSAVTGRHSNQLNYRIFCNAWKNYLPLLWLQIYSFFHYLQTIIINFIRIRDKLQSINRIIFKKSFNLINYRLKV